MIIQNIFSILAFSDYDLNNLSALGDTRMFWMLFQGLALVHGFFFFSWEGKMWMEWSEGIFWIKYLTQFFQPGDFVGHLTHSKLSEYKYKSNKKT